MRSATEDDDLQQIEVSEIEETQPLTMPKTVLKAIDKSTDYYLRYALGYPTARIPEEKENSSEMDEWCSQFCRSCLKENPSSNSMFLYSPKH